MLLRLLAIVVLLSVLTLGPASASDVEGPERCTAGAISAIGPVDAAGNGDTTPDVRCLEP
jgi:hypothetical protein